MKKFSPKLFAIGVALGALGAVAVLATSAYARSPQKETTESGRPVLDWDQELIAIVNTPGAQPPTVASSTPAG